MDLKQVFINSAGRLRSGWRLLIFVLLFVILSIVFGFIANLSIVFGSIANKTTQLAVDLSPSRAVAHYVENLITRLVLLFAALGAGYISARWLEGLPWRSLGLSLHPRWLRDLLVGSLLGIASLVVTLIIATAGRGLTFTVSGSWTFLQLINSLVFSAALFVIAALAEETLFRGYPLQTLTRANLAWLAVLLTSVPFATVHLKNPNVASGFTFVNTALAGVWLAVAYLRTRSLWFPLGVHWAWNWAMASLFGLPVSGITDLAPHSLLKGIDLGPAWLTGGTYGPEGGAACTVALIISTVFIWRTRLISATPEMKLLTSQENPVPGLISIGEPAVSSQEGTSIG